MTIASDICTRALSRLRVIGADETPAASDMALALVGLNDMMFAWKDMHVDLQLQGNFAGSDTFTFWVPPDVLSGNVLNVISYVGTWNAATNTPTLSSSNCTTVNPLLFQTSGTSGVLYKVSTAGTTT
ncbi:MAG: hypothetical protein KGP14_08140, partial [Betaproteobacteria bacterium]|nr:hypothetical protein [Betaproteobacteria bacterium]